MGIASKCTESRYTSLLRPDIEYRYSESTVTSYGNENTSNENLQLAIDLRDRQGQVSISRLASTSLLTIDIFCSMTFPFEP